MYIVIMIFVVAAIATCKPLDNIKWRIFGNYNFMTTSRQVGSMTINAQISAELFGTVYTVFHHLLYLRMPCAGISELIGDQ